MHENLDWFVMLHGQNGDNYDANGLEMLEPTRRRRRGQAGYEFGAARLEAAGERSQDDADRVIKMNMDLDGDETVYPLDIDSETFSLKLTSTAPSASWDLKRSFISARRITGGRITPWAIFWCRAAARPNGDMGLAATHSAG